MLSTWNLGLDSQRIGVVPIPEPDHLYLLDDTPNDGATWLDAKLSTNLTQTGNNISSVAGVVGNAMSMNGAADNYLRSAHNLCSDTAFTVAWFFRKTGSTGSSQYYIGEQTTAASAATSRWTAIVVNNGTIVRVLISDGVSGDWYTAGTSAQINVTITDAKWRLYSVHFVAPNSWTVWCGAADPATEQSGTRSKAMNSADLGFALGSNSAGGTHMYGDLDHVAVWATQSLTRAQVISYMGRPPA